METEKSISTWQSIKLRFVFGSAVSQNARVGEPRAAFGIRVTGDKINAEISQSMCDDTRNTRELVELYALKVVLEFVGEISALGRPNIHRVNARRFVGTYPMEVEIVQLLPDFFESSPGAFARLNGALWGEVKDMYHALKSKVAFDFRYTEENDPDIAAACALAKARMQSGIGMAYVRRSYCVNCGELEDEFSDLCTHVKTKHLGRDVIDESMVAALTVGYMGGEFACVRCDRAYDGQRRLLKHMRKMHFPDVYCEESMVEARRISGKFDAPAPKATDKDSEGGSDSSDMSD